jgi:hypothetical protein
MPGLALVRVLEVSGPEALRKAASRRPLLNHDTAVQDQILGASPTAGAWVRQEEIAGKYNLGSAACVADELMYRCDLCRDEFSRRRGRYPTDDTKR